MRYLSPVASQKHLNAHMIEGMLGLHTVWLHYYPGISKLMHFTKKKNKKLVWRRREGIYIWLAQAAYESSVMISAKEVSLRDSSCTGLPITQKCSFSRGLDTPFLMWKHCRSLLHCTGMGRPEPESKSVPVFYSDPDGLSCQH